jgi:hypothetical protein
MSLDRELRAVLAERAAGCAVPAPDLRALQAGGVRRRRRRRVVVAMATCVVLGTVAAGLAVGLGQRDTRGAVDPVDRPSPRVVESTRVPWCVQDPNDPAGQLIIGAGPAIRAQCSGWHLYFWHHAGSTVLARGGIYRVADGRETWLGRGGGKVVMSHDGRYAAWMETGETNCGTVTLHVYEVATADKVATTRIPGYSCSHVQGIDDRGRVYVTVGDETPGDLEVQMYDVWSDSWARVVGLPAGADSVSITYVTPDGLAVSTDEQIVGGNPLPLASVEVVIDAEGQVRRQREVPVGAGLWSPDRSLVVDQRPEGVVVRRAVDLTTQVLLDVPASAFRGEAQTTCNGSRPAPSSSRRPARGRTSWPVGRPTGVTFSPAPASASARPASWRWATTSWRLGDRHESGRDPGHRASVVSSPGWTRHPRCRGSRPGGVQLRRPDW